MTRKCAALVCLCMLSAFAAGIAQPAAAAPIPQATGQTFTVLVGGQSTPEPTEAGLPPAGAWQYMRFYPENITVNVGDTIVWKINSVEQHQVVFPSPTQKFVPLILTEAGTSGPPSVVVNPLAAFPQGGSTYDGSTLTGSGNMGMTAPGVQEYRLTFTKAGTFTYFCSAHSGQLPNGQVVGMIGSVTVQAAGTAYPRTAAQVDADAKAALAADDAAAAAAEPQATQVAPPTQNADGTMTYHGNVGWDAGLLSYMRFAPEDFTIHVGDTIEWTQTSAMAPHTVTLPSSGAEPEAIVVQPQPTGPPRILFNPVMLAPAGGTQYNGTGYFNSGLMPGTQDPAPGPRKYSLTFTRPGKFEYICIPHDEMGMNGIVTVLAAGGTPGMPTTGQGDPAWLAWLALGVTLLGSGLALTRRRARA